MGSTINPDRIMKEQHSSPGPQQRPSQPRQLGDVSNKSTGRGRPPKERLSCDACAAAKVKCGKERPRCERCIEGDLTCVYGLSMKYGKGSKKRRQQQNAQYQAQNRNNQQASSLDDFWQQSYTNLLNSFSNASSTLPNIIPWSPPTTSHSMLADSLSFATPAPPPMFPPPLDTNDMAWMDGILPSSTDVRGTGNVSSPIPDLGICRGNEHFDKMFDLLTTDDSTSLDMGGANSPRRSSSMNSLTEPHELYSLAHSTLNSLSLDQKQTTGYDGSASGGPLDDTTPNLEDVLRSTKGAMSNLEHLLSSSFAADPHISIMCASIIMRILFWHQMASGGRRSSESLRNLSNSPELKSRSDSVLGYQTPTSSSQHPAIDSGPVHIGGHMFEEEDQGPMRLMFLLSNLKKLARLLETFRSVGPRENSENPSTQLHAHVCNTLQWELGQVMNEVGAAAKSSTAAWVASQQA